MSAAKMNTVRAIRTNDDYEAALARIDELMDATPNTPEGDELDVLVDLVSLYESKHVPMRAPTPLAAIQFRLEQAGLTARDLVPLIGSRAKVSEVLSGKRALTLPMARALHQHLGIPAESLLGSAATLPTTQAGRNYPLSAMAKLGWIPRVRNMVARADELVGALARAAGAKSPQDGILFRKSDLTRQNAKADPYALQAWCWKVIASAREEKKADAKTRAATITLPFLREVAKLSRFGDGPKRAHRYLAEHGIVFLVVPHLPKTYLDGAALALEDGTPVVALTLRYDRVDNFWFCLLHELAHIGRHIQRGDRHDVFIDDLSLRDSQASTQELEADEWAEEALVPRQEWERSVASRNPTPASVIGFANEIEVHPAVVAGKVRHTQNNYRLLSHFVGAGEVRRHFLEP
ncbi:MAG: transcriptional regulator [Deltaproteobacteria bacterium]|nr:transcriptional regulator [Deltaproteobacteria bacterium]